MNSAWFSIARRNLVSRKRTGSVGQWLEPLRCILGSGSACSCDDQPSPETDTVRVTRSRTDSQLITISHCWNVLGMKIRPTDTPEQYTIPTQSFPIKAEMASSSPRESGHDRGRGRGKGRDAKSAAHSLFRELHEACGFQRVHKSPGSAQV